MQMIRTLSWALSRIAFLATHAVFALWLNFLLNDPFNLGGVSADHQNEQPMMKLLQPTLDARQVVAPDRCTKLDTQVPHTWPPLR